MTLSKTRFCCCVNVPSLDTIHHNLKLVLHNHMARSRASTVILTSTAEQSMEAAFDDIDGGFDLGHEGQNQPPQ